MLVPNINRLYSTVFEKLNNEFSWPLMESILICCITWELILHINKTSYVITCSYWLTISSILQEFLQHRFLTLIQNYHSYVLTRFTFLIGRYGNVVLFFSIASWISQFLPSFSTFRQVINCHSRCQGYFTHNLIETTNSLIERKTRSRRCQKTWIPMKFSTNYCGRHFIRVQLQSERLRLYYLNIFYIYKISLQSFSISVHHIFLTFHPRLDRFSGSSFPMSPLPASPR